MKKLVVQIHQFRFELESTSAEGDARALAAAREVTDAIDRLRRDHKILDSARVATLAAFVLALEAKNRDNAVPEGGWSALEAQADAALARTDESYNDDFPAKAITQ